MHCSRTSPLVCQIRSFLVFALLALAPIAGCGMFRDSGPSLPPHPAGQVESGVPANLPSTLPMHADAGDRNTYHVPEKNHFFFASDEPIDDVRAYYEQELPAAGYELRRVRDLPGGGVALEFVRAGKVGMVSIASGPPEGTDPRLGLRGTYVDVVYDLSPPPAPPPA